MQVKAKFYVSEVQKLGAVNNINVKLFPVTRKDDTDNIDWAKYTPGGQLQMSVSTETKAAQWFEDMLGKDISLTFEAVES